MATTMKRTVGGIKFDAVCFSDGRVSLSAEMTIAEHAERSEVWSGLRRSGWAIDLVTHEQDADIVDAGKVWINMVSAA